jgi:predicted dehydrogenase
MTELHRIAIVGCGGVSDMHFRGELAHPERVSIVAACDPDEERRRFVAENYGVADTYAGLDELIAGADFDVAVVLTPSHVRLDTVRALAAGGKHVYVEKPMADTMGEARAIVAACRDAGVKLAVDQNFRHHYAFGLARRAIDAGAIGRVVGIDHRELLFREVVGWRATSPHHALSVMGVHWLDGFRLLLPDDADWVAARSYASPALSSVGESDAFVQLHFGPATVNYTQSFSSRIERVETIVIGETGTLALTYGELVIARADGTVETVANSHAGEGKPESAYLGLAALLDTIGTDTEPANSGQDNLKTLALLAAAYLSAESDEPVALAGGLL